MKASLRVVAAIAVAATVRAQPPTPTLHVTFADAIQRAMDRNPTVQAAAAAILRAEGLLRQSRAATLLQVTGNITSTTLNTGVEFQGTTVTPRSQVTGLLTADMPIVAAAAWARRAQAEDNRGVAQFSSADTRRQVAFSAADAYLTIIGWQRVVEANTRARDTAKEHFDLASELERRGAGSRLNALRAQQQWSADEGLVEVARLALYRAQEALGVLIAADAPADVVDVPPLDLPADAGAQDLPALRGLRTDLRLFTAEQQAAEHVVRDSSKDWWPTLDALFQPSSTYPSQFFLPANSWRLLLQANVPIFDSGLRAGTKIERQSSLDQARATLAGAETQAASQVRAAREAVASAGRSLASARQAADEAQQVLEITNISFRAGASTNIEVIDAGRSARDADTAVAVVEDTLRRAKLELLNAIGRFP